MLRWQILGSMYVLFFFLSLQALGEENSQLTKDWGGARTKLSEMGVDVSLVFKEEVNRNLSGGLKHDTVYLDNIDLQFAFDGDKLAGLKGTSAFFYIVADHGGDPTKNVGDDQGTSNIETNADTARVYELWIQQLFLDEKVSLLVGVHDLNSEFYVTDSSGPFFNSSFGVGRELAQTGVNGPSIFPIAAPAARLRVDAAKSFYLQIAAFNGQSGDLNKAKGTHLRYNREDGLLVITEAAYLRGNEDSNQLSGKYAIGTWSYTSTFDHLTQVNDSGATPVKTTSHGTYFLADQTLAKGVSVFLRYGVASSQVNAIRSNLGTGVLFTGLLPSREDDQFGLGMTKVRAGREDRESHEAAGEPIEKAETTFEANYRIEVCPGVAIQPDLQYVMNPSMEPAVKNALVAATRLELNF